MMFFGDSSFLEDERDGGMRSGLPNWGGADGEVFGSS